VVMFGLDAAGKTTLLYRLKLGETVTTIPTVGFNVETIHYKAHVFTVWDCGLRGKARPLLRHYVQPGSSQTDLIFVFDSNDRDRLEEAQEFLSYGLHCWQEGMDNGLPETASPPRLLIFANKQDLPKAMSVEEVREALTAHVRSVNVHVQACHASTGEGLYEGLSFLATGAIPASPSGQARGTKEVEQEVESASEASTVNDDEAFLKAFTRGDLNSVGVEEALRAAYLHRVRLHGATPRLTLELCKQATRSPIHATRLHYWICKVYGLQLGPGVESFKDFRSAHPLALPGGASEQEAELRKAYSPATLEDRVAALIPVPPDASACSHEDSDEDFLWRVEHPDGNLDLLEVQTFYGTSRLAYALLDACENRRAAIQRMDAACRRLEFGWLEAAQTGLSHRAYHETKQYVALHLVHAAKASRPDICSFRRLAGLYVELCEEVCVLDYYSEGALAKGLQEFVVPDKRPLPTTVTVPVLGWHQDLQDHDFLTAYAEASLSTWGFPALVRVAYLLLFAHGRRDALARILGMVESLQQAGCSNGTVCANETLAYFALHMVHYYSIISGALSMTPYREFADFIGQHPDVADPALPSKYYSDASLYSKEARVGLVLPDLRPLPDVVPESK